MKTLTLLLVLTLSISFTFAQDALTTGNRIFGGGLSFYHKDAENDNPYNNFWIPSFDSRTLESSFSISPYYGRIYDDLKMVGIRFSYRGSDREITFEDEFASSIDEISRKSFGVGGFIRRYFPASEKFGGFLQFGIGLNRSITINRFRDENLGDGGVVPIRRDEYENKALGASIDGSFGIYYFLLPQLSVETNLARFVLAYDDIKVFERDLINNETFESDGSSSEVNLNLVNEFTFDKIFTLNYYF